MTITEFLAATLAVFVLCAAPVVIIDVVFLFLAVRRRRRQRLPPDTQQRLDRITQDHAGLWQKLADAPDNTTPNGKDSPHP